MLRSTVSLVIATFCWTHSSLGFAPSSGKPGPQTSHSPTVIRYSDAVIEEQKEDLKSRLPPVNRQHMSKLEVEFRELLKAMLFTPEEMSSITNPRLRIIYEGVAASYYEPAVYRAFEVLFEDYMPLRLAGRVIHGKLQKTMTESREYQQDQIQRVMADTDYSLQVVGRCWESFVRMAGARELDIERAEQLLRRGQELEILPFKDSEIMSNANGNANANPKQRESLTFEELVAGFRAVSPSGLSEEKFEELFQADIAPVSHNARLDAKREKYSQRYDEMLVKFGEWKSFIPSGSGRRLDILRGCFVGSENDKVVDALRVIYTDYSALRMSGDWIFQVVSTLMKGAMKRRQKNEESSP